MVGVGITGDLIGDTGPSSTTTTLTSPTVTPSLIAATILEGAITLVVTGPTILAVADLITDLHHEVRNPDCTPERSAVSITEGWQEASPSAAVLVSVAVDSMEAVADFMVVVEVMEAVTGNRPSKQSPIYL
jgi:hypothetical protein